MLHASPLGGPGWLRNTGKPQNTQRNKDIPFQHHATLLHWEGISKGNLLLGCGTCDMTQIKGDCTAASQERHHGYQGCAAAARRALTHFSILLSSEVCKPSDLTLLDRQKTSSILKLLARAREQQTVSCYEIKLKCNKSLTWENMQINLNFVTLLNSSTFGDRGCFSTGK